MHLRPLLAVVSLVCAAAAALASPHHQGGLPAHRRHPALHQPGELPVRRHPIESAYRKRADGKRCRPRSSPTTSLQPDPKPTTTKAAPPPPKPTLQAPPPPPPSPQPASPKPAPPPPPPPPPAPQQQSTGFNFLLGVNAGQGTYYDTGLGACGIWNNNNDFIAAASHELFDSFPGYNGANPNNNPMCGRKVRASYNGKSVVVFLTDRCEACKMRDLDFSPAAFKQLADQSLGRIQITWEWA